jgi:HD superfamily phosphohydrolase
MTRLEDLETKEEIIHQYYSWLLDTNDVTLEKQLDLSLVQNYNDPYIYYPKCMHDLFHTEKLQRLGRISQLASMFSVYPGAYHSRLDHSIGAFSQKQEEHIYLWLQNPEFIAYIENNNLKKYLLAEEIKMLYHDVGHFPFSHVTEQQIIGKRGIHEEIGQTILLTDTEICAATQKLGISQELQTVLFQDVFNSHEHDEGNIDVDRKDYLQRDTLHIGGPNFSYYPIYSRKIAKIAPDGSYKKSPDGSVILCDSLGAHSKFIDVYSYSDLPKVEDFFYARETQYKNKYFHSTTLTRDTLLSIVLRDIAPKHKEYCSDLIDYITFLKSEDYESAQKYDDIRIYKSLINLGLNCSDQNVVDMVSLLFVPFDNWLESIYEQIDRTVDYDFIKTIHHDLIKGTSRFSKNIKNKNFFAENVILIEGENSSKLKQKGFLNLIYNSHSLSAYNPSCPVFIENTNGKAFALENHPDRSRDWLDTRTYSQIAICILPLLRLQGLSAFEIADYSMECKQMKADTSINSSLMPSINMKHLQTGHNITSHFFPNQEDSWDNR